MSYQVDWDTRIINIPQADLIYISPGIYKLDLEEAHQEFRRLEWDFQEGLSRVDILEYIPPLEAGGVIYARFVLLMNGYTVTFEDGQYAVNFDGANTNIHDYTNVNQVSVRPNNSAGLQDLSTLLSSAYNGEVVLDIINGQSGTGSPIGTRSTPVGNMNDAVAIAGKQNTDKIEVIGNVTLGLGHNVSSMLISGTSRLTSLITVEPAALAFSTRYEEAEITGVLDGGSQINYCNVKTLDYFNGTITNSTLDERITLSGNEAASFSRCEHADINNPPVIDAGGSGQDLIMTEYSGQIILDNLTGDSVIGIGLVTGKVIINDTCTGGTINISGNGSVVNNSGEGCYVVDKTVDGSEISNLHLAVEQLRPHHTGTGRMIYWDPYSGNDAWAGDHPDRAFKTWTKSHDSAGNANHDTIVIVPGDPTGVTLITEQINVTKDYLFIRGPGRDVIVFQDTLEDALITSARGTEFSGFRVQNITAGGHGIHSTGAFTLASNLWFEQCANGVYGSGQHPLIHSCKFHGQSGYGIKLEGDVAHGEIYDCTIGAAGGNGIEINTSAAWGGIKMRDTVIVQAGGYGVALSATTQRFVSQSGNVITNNTLGDFNNLGTDNVLNTEEIWSTKSDVFNASQI